LHQNNFREYDPSLGIYKQSDLIGLLGGINTYVYPQDPLGDVDVLGLRRGGGKGTVGMPLPFLALTVIAPVFPSAEYRGPTSMCGADGGARFPNTFDGIGIDNVCARHDRCYGSRCGVTRETCDREMLDDFKATCGNQPRCLLGAYSYYWALRRFGEDAFLKGRERCRSGECR
jgi:hypothetical protein